VQIQRSGIREFWRQVSENIEAEKPKFELEQPVQWTSQSQGTMKTKHGAIAAIIYPKYHPDRDKFPDLFTGDGVGKARQEISYVVRVPPVKEGRKPRHYWPIVKHLKAAELNGDAPAEAAAEVPEETKTIPFPVAAVETDTQVADIRADLNGTEVALKHEAPVVARVVEPEDAREMRLIWFTLKAALGETFVACVTEQWVEAVRQGFIHKEVDPTPVLSKDDQIAALTDQVQRQDAELKIAYSKSKKPSEETLLSIVRYVMDRNYAALSGDDEHKVKDTQVANMFKDWKANER
jgi:hypothetical protein